MIAVTVLGVAADRRSTGVVIRLEKGELQMKVVLCSNSDFGTWRFRKCLIEALIARGIEVTVLTPEGPFVPKLRSLGARHVAIPLCQFNSPLRDLKLCFHLYRIFRAERPDIVHNATVKPNTYGAIAAWLAGVPKVVSLVSGAGCAFRGAGGWKQAMLRWIVSRLYWLAAKVTTRTWFLNEDDLSLFLESGLVAEDKAVLIVSEGIDLDEFSPDEVAPSATSKLRDELGFDASTRVVLMLACALWSKGVREFVEASEYAARWKPRVVFVLAGPLSSDAPDRVPETYLRSKTSPHFKWLGLRDDVKELLAVADVVTLASLDREGVPMSLLEGLAMKKPIVATDIVGCREVVDEGRNGFLVPSRDSAALASAIETLAGDSALRASFGRHSRAKAQAEFDKSLVVARVLAEVYQLDEQTPVAPIRKAV